MWEFSNIPDPREAPGGALVLTLRAHAREVLEHVVIMLFRACSNYLKIEAWVFG